MAALARIGKAHADGIDVSVIIPIYNVAEYLCACLDSLLHQEDVSLEVIMVDDGSSDGSGQIADEYALAHERWHVFHRPNGGPGRARNFGVAHAQGRYLSFLDADDMLANGILGRMLHAAEHNGTDMVVCNGVRFNSERVWGSSLHIRTFREFEPVTHVSRNHALLNDTIMCGKLIRRSFYEEQGCAFPEGILYEDILPAVSLHLACNGVSMIVEHGYFWREREGFSKSTTQRISSLRNLRDRLTVSRMLFEHFRKSNVEASLFEAQQLKTIRVCFPIFADVCANMSQEDARTCFDLINEFIDDEIDERLFARLYPIEQQKCERLRAGDVKGYAALRAYQLNGYQQAPVIERDCRLYADLPDELFTTASRDVTQEFQETGWRTYIDRIAASDGALEIYGHLYHWRYNMTHEGDARISVELVNEETDTRIPLDADLVKTEFLTKRFGQVTSADGTHTQYNYDWAGFHVLVDVALLARLGIPSGVYTFLIDYQGRLLSVRKALAGVGANDRRLYQGRSWVHDDMSVVFDITTTDMVRLDIERPVATIDGLSFEGGRLCFRTIEPVHKMQLVGKGELPLRRSLRDRRRFTLHADALSPSEEYQLVGRAGRDGAWLSAHAPSGVSVLVCEKCVVIASSMQAGVLRLSAHELVSVATQMHKDKGLLKVVVEPRGALALVEGCEKVQLYVADELVDRETVLAEGRFEKSGGGRFCGLCVDFVDRAITDDFHASVRDVMVRYLLSGGKSIETPLYGTEAFNFTYDVRYRTLRILCHLSARGSVCLELLQMWPEAESTPQKRAALTEERYPRYRKEPLEESRILFEPTAGKVYGGSLRRLYEYLSEHYPDYECVWSFADALTPINGQSKRVRRGSQEHFRMLATAGLIVTDGDLDVRYVERPGQAIVYLKDDAPLEDDAACKAFVHELFGSTPGGE